MRPLIIGFLISLFPLVTLGQQVELRGVLKTDAGRRVPGTRIGIAGGQEDITDSNGRFRIVLSRDFKEGEPVIIKVIKEGWIINHPLDGEWNLPNRRLQALRPLDVVIVPKGSKLL